MLAAKNDLDINQVQYSPKLLPDQGLLAYSLEFSVTGSYGEIKHFIFGLEQSPRLISIDQLGLSAAARPGRQRQVALSLRLTTYFRSEGEK